jgi:uroporphyrinogen decarboxylase
MISKERVLAALEGRIPDRVPHGEFAIDFDTVQKILGHETYLRAKAKSQIAFWEGRQEEVAESYLKDHIELHEKLELDIVTFPAATWEIPPETDDASPRKINENTWEDKYGRVFKHSEATHDITCVKDPVNEAKKYSPEDFDKEPLPVPRDERSWKILDTVIQKFKNAKFICGPSGGEIGVVFLGGIEKGLMKLIQNPDTVKAATEYLLRQQNLSDETMIHPDSDAVMWAVDFGYKTGPFISPHLFRDLFLEVNRARAKQVHQKFGKKIIKHCCGNVNSLLDFFIEIGYDAYQSIQPTADMDICALKRKYGEKITLWGGVAVENLMEGTPDDVRRDVRRAMGCAKPGGRFILGTSHSVAVGSRYENFMAMLDEYHKLYVY